MSGIPETLLGLPVVPGWEDMSGMYSVVTMTTLQIELKNVEVDIVSHDQYRREQLFPTIASSSTGQN